MSKLMFVRIFSQFSGFEEMKDFRVKSITSEPDFKSEVNIVLHYFPELFEQNVALVY